MSEKVKVLYFLDRMRKGGIQSLILEIAKSIDTEKIQLDFLILDDGNDYELEETLRKLGNKVYKLKGIWIKKPTDFISYCKALKQFFKHNHNYKVVHMHSSSKNFMVLKYAKKYSIPVRIAHSHNLDFQTQNKIKKIIGDLMKKPLKYYATNYFACSKLAGEWLFGKKGVNSDKFLLIHNAIDLEKFKFDDEIRNNLRNKLGIDKNTLVIGNVGRFVEQKNHKFLIDVFYEIYKRDKKAKLLLVGTGEKEEEIKNKVKGIGIEKNVIWAGFQNNVNEYMFAMDKFVFPSLFEGLGIVLIEAQVAGLQCYTSAKVVPQEAKISRGIRYISLQDSAKKWAQEILETKNKQRIILENLEENDYNIKKMIKKLEIFYIE